MKKRLLFCLLSLFILALPVKFVKAEAMVNVNVEVNAYFDDENYLSSNLESQQYGKKVSVSGNIPAAPVGYEDYEFFCWVVNGFYKPDLPVDHQFVVRGQMILTAIFKPADKYLVMFIDANSEVITGDYVSPGGNATAPDVSGYTKPGMVASATPWGDAVLTNINENMIVYLEYEFDNLNTYEVVVNNGSGDNAAAVYGSIATAVADDGGSMAFSHWVDENGKIVSYESTHSFTVYKDTTITAEYAGVTPDDEPYIVISDLMRIYEGGTTFIGQYHVPSGYTVVEYGIACAYGVSNFFLDDEETSCYQSEKLNAQTNEFMMSFVFENDRYVKGYLVVENASTHELEYYYSEPEHISYLMFSEYGEGSGNNKWLEIYNPTNETVNLSDYSVEVYFNGESAPGSTLEFTTETIMPGDVYVIANSAANADILDEADKTSSVATFNGNDAVALLKDGIVIDIIGVIGEDPGSSWPLPSFLGQDYSTEDHTLIKGAGMSYFADGVMDTMKWKVRDTDYIDNLGFHEEVDPFALMINGPITVMEGASIQLSLTFDPLDSKRNIYDWEISNEAIATVDNTGLVTGVSTGEVTITVTSSVNESVFDTHVVTVVAPTCWDVTYDSNEGSAVDPESVVDGTTATEPPAPTRTGYAFAGWYLDDVTFADQYDFDTAVTADITLYAKWDAAGSYASDLFFSEYIEGSSYNKVIEIYNGTGTQVDLSIYKVELYTNSASTPSESLELSGLLSHNAVATIYHGQADSDFQDKGEINFGYSKVANWNGDDTVVLKRGDIIIDVFGQIGTDPGTSWSANGVQTVDRTLVRKSTVKAGDAIGSDAFDPSVEWIQREKDDSSCLGSHTMS